MDVEDIQEDAVAVGGEEHDPRPLRRRPAPAGWRELGMNRGANDGLAYIEQVLTDMQTFGLGRTWDEPDGGSGG